MKVVTYVMNCLNNNDNFLEVLLQPGWYQYIEYVHTNPLSAGNHYFKEGLYSKVVTSFTDAGDGGLIFLNMRYCLVVTTGGMMTPSMGQYKLFNWKIENPKKVTVYVKIAAIGDEKVRINFRYTKKKLLEVI